MIKCLNHLQVTVIFSIINDTKVNQVWGGGGRGGKVLVIQFYAITKDDKTNTPVNSLCLCGTTVQHIKSHKPDKCLALFASPLRVISHNLEVMLDKSK
jgi:hypothetical protein